LAGAALDQEVIALPIGSAAPWRVSVLSALIGLGYSSREADDALLAIGAEVGENPDVSALLRLALRSLGRA
jgi:Holliday junction DNA helicase RuvA